MIGIITGNIQECRLFLGTYLLPGDTGPHRRGAWWPWQCPQEEASPRWGSCECEQKGGASESSAKRRGTWQGHYTLTLLRGPPSKGEHSFSAKDQLNSSQLFQGVLAHSQTLPPPSTFPSCRLSQPWCSHPSGLLWCVICQWSIERFCLNLRYPHHKFQTSVNYSLHIKTFNMPLTGIPYHLDIENQNKSLLG